MRRLGIASGEVFAAIGAAFALVWFVPSIQDAIVKRVVVGQIAKADAAAAFKDDALHILLCGTGSPKNTIPASPTYLSSVPPCLKTISVISER